MAERLNCIQNQITIANRVLIQQQGRGVHHHRRPGQHPGGGGRMLTFWGELGFVFPAFPFIAHSRGWDAEDMENNVRQVKASEALRTRPPSWSTARSTSGGCWTRTAPSWTGRWSAPAARRNPMVRRRERRPGPLPRAAPERPPRASPRPTRPRSSPGAWTRSARCSPTTSPTGWPGAPPLGGEWRGREAVLRAFERPRVRARRRRLGLRGRRGATGTTPTSG